MSTMPSFSASSLQQSRMAASLYNDFEMYSAIQNSVALGIRKPTISKANVVNIALSKKGAYNQDVATKISTNFVTDYNSPNCSALDNTALMIEYLPVNANGSGRSFTDPGNYANCLQATINSKYSNYTNVYQDAIWNSTTVDNQNVLCPSMNATYTDSNWVTHSVFVTNCTCAGPAGVSAFPCS